MRAPTLHLLSMSLFNLLLLESIAEANFVGAWLQHLPSILEWAMPSSTSSQTDENVIQFEKGYLIETVAMRGNELGIEPCSIRVSPEGELFAVDSVNSKIVRIAPPLSQYSRARLVAGSFKGYSGYVDGKTTDARFRHPKGVAVDDKGNVYVADIQNKAIRKIGEAGVTTLAGGKSKLAGYMDGPSEDAKFSGDFDLVYLRHSCSLLVVDRGNVALREIQLRQEDCRQEDVTDFSSYISIIIFSILAGYVTCMLQHGFGPSSKTIKHDILKSEVEEPSITHKPKLLVVTQEEDSISQWPSLGRVICDLLQISFDALIGMLLHFIPLGLGSREFKKGVASVIDIDTMMMPKDDLELPSVTRADAPSLSEFLQPPTNSSNIYTQKKLQKSKRGIKHQETTNVSRTDTATMHKPPRSNKNDGTLRRPCDVSGRAVSGTTWAGSKPFEIKPMNHDDPEFDRYMSNSNSMKGF